MEQLIGGVLLVLGFICLVAGVLLSFYVGREIRVHRRKLDRLVQLHRMYGDQEGQDLVDDILRRKEGNREQA